MAVNNCTCASIPPLLSSKSHHSNPPRFHPHPNFPKFDRCSFPTVSWRQNLGSLSTSDSRLVRASASASDSGSDSESREPMLPPYNVLITGSTKGHSLFFRVFFFFRQILGCGCCFLLGFWYGFLWRLLFSRILYWIFWISDCRCIQRTHEIVMVAYIPHELWLTFSSLDSATSTCFLCNVEKFAFRNPNTRRYGLGNVELHLVQNSYLMFFHYFVLLLDCILQFLVILKI